VVADHCGGEEVMKEEKEEEERERFGGQHEHE